MLSSAELGTLIAIGAGVGNADMDPEKARYPQDHHHDRC